MKKQALTRYQICWSMVLDSPTSRTMKNNFLVYKPPNLQYFCYSNLNELRFSTKALQWGDPSPLTTDTFTSPPKLHLVEGRMSHLLPGDGELLQLAGCHTPQPLPQLSSIRPTCLRIWKLRRQLAVLPDRQHCTANDKRKKSTS